MMGWIHRYRAHRYGTQLYLKNMEHTHILAIVAPAMIFKYFTKASLANSTSPLAVNQSF